MLLLSWGKCDCSRDVQGVDPWPWIGPEEAVELKTFLHGMDSAIGTEALNIRREAADELSNIGRAAVEDGQEVLYYQISVELSIPELTDFNIMMTSLMVVLNGEETRSHKSTYIRLVEPPAITADVQAAYLEWVPGGSSAYITDRYQTAVSFYISGYVEAQLMGPIRLTWSSETLGQEVVFTLDMLGDEAGLLQNVGFSPESKMNT